MERSVISKENMHINICFFTHQKACRRAENGRHHSKWRRNQQVTSTKHMEMISKDTTNRTKLLTHINCLTRDYNIRISTPFATVRLTASYNKAKPQIKIQGNPKKTKQKIPTLTAGKVLPSVCHGEPPLFMAVVVDKHPSEEARGVPWRQPGRNGGGRAAVPPGSLLLQEVLPQDLHQVLVQPDVLGHGRHCQRVLVAHGRLLGHPHASPFLLPLLGAKTKKCPLIRRKTPQGRGEQEWANELWASLRTPHGLLAVQTSD